MYIILCWNLINKYFLSQTVCNLYDHCLLRSSAALLYQENWSMFVCKAVETSLCVFVWKRTHALTFTNNIIIHVVVCVCPPISYFRVKWAHARGATQTMLYTLKSTLKIYFSTYTRVYDKGGGRPDVLRPYITMYFLAGATEMCACVYLFRVLVENILRKYRQSTSSSSSTIPSKIASELSIKQRSELNWKKITSCLQ